MRCRNRENVRLKCDFVLEGEDRNIAENDPGIERDAVRVNDKRDIWKQYYCSTYEGHFIATSTVIDIIAICYVDVTRSITIICLL